MAFETRPHLRYLPAVSNGLWKLGWAMVLFGFASGAALGLGFHREGFLGGYGSFTRRLVRLGHVACVMLGVLSMLVAISPAGALDSQLAIVSRGIWCFGAVGMPLTCFVVAWKPTLRHLFAFPVTALIAAAGLTLFLV